MLFAKAFGSLGSIVGSRPLTFFVGSLVVFFLSAAFLAVFPPEARLGLDKGYTTKDAPSIRELRTQIGFFGNKGDPWYMALFAEPRDEEKGSMIESGEFDEFKDFYKGVKSEIVIRREDNRSTTYMDYCDNTCEINEQIFKTVALAWFGLQWPQTSIFMFKSNIGKYFFLREMKGQDIVRSRLSALYFLVFINSTDVASDMSRFEEQVAHRVAAHNANDTKLTTITQYGARGMQQEISRGMKFVFAKLIGGVVLAVFFVLLSFILLNRIHRRSSSRVAALTLAAGALPLMALVSAMASCSFLGLHTNSISVVALALAYAVGIDGALILYNTWIADTRRSSQVEQMAKVFSSCVPSLTAISSVAIGLLAGGLFPVEEFAGLSSYLGFTVLFVNAYQICFFTSVMAWCCPIETHRQLPQEASKPPRMPPKPVFDALLGRFAHSLSSSAWLKIFATSVFCLCLALPTYIGSAKVKSNIDYRDLLPDDSPSNKGVHLMSDVVWPEFFNVLFFIENPPHFDDPVGYSRFKKLISEIESLPGAVNNAGMMWVNDFERHTDMVGNETALNMTLFKDFITHDIYKAWNSGVKYRHEGDRVVVTKMLYITAFENVRTMMDKAVLLTQCRQIAARFPEMDVVPFDTDVTMIDVVLQIPYVTYFIPLFVLVASAAVTVILIGNLVVSLVCVCSAAAIFLEAFCISALMGVILNPFSAAFLVVVAALSVKSSTHICYSFQQAVESDYHRDDAHRLTLAFKRMYIPVVLSTIAGSLVLLPVIATNVAIFRWIAVINVCYLVGGAFHSLLFTPLLLIWMPQTLTGRRFFCTATKQANDVAMKNLNVL